MVGRGQLKLARPDSRVKEQFTSERWGRRTKKYTYTLQRDSVRDIEELHRFLSPSGLPPVRYIRAGVSAGLNSIVVYVHCANCRATLPPTTSYRLKKGLNCMWREHANGDL